MNKDERIEVSKKREYLVVKGNELIQKNRFELSLTEQKTVAYICSMIKPIDIKDNIMGIPYQLEYEFNIRDYCKVCGIDYDAGKNYADVKSILKHLRDRSMWLTMPDGSESLVGWLAKVNTYKKSGIVKIRIDEDLVPYLYELKERFTQYQLYNILAMKSAFSVRIYELMKSYEYQKNKIFDLAELKQLLGVENVKSYKEFAPFRQKVLEVVEREINELTDINISYETIKKGTKVVKINFSIKLKSPIDRAIAGTTACDRLNNTASN